MKNGIGIGWLGLGIGAVALVSGILSIPVWKQNRYLGLMRVQVELEQERLGLDAEISKIDMESRKLRSLSRIEPAAKAIGLDFYSVPLKVMEIARPSAQGGK